MSADVASDPHIAAAYAELRRPDSPLDWFITSYAPDGPNRLVLGRTGDGGLRSLVIALNPNKPDIYFGILRFERRYLLFTCLPEDAGGVRRARALVHSRAVGAKFPHNGSVTVARPEELSEAVVRSKLKLDSDAATPSLPPSPNPQYSPNLQHSPTTHLNPTPSPLRGHFTASPKASDSPLQSGYHIPASGPPLLPDKDLHGQRSPIPGSPREAASPLRVQLPNGRHSPALGSPRTGAPIYATHAVTQAASPIASPRHDSGAFDNMLSPRQRGAPRSSPLSSPSLADRPFDMRPVSPSAGLATLSPQHSRTGGAPASPRLAEGNAFVMQTPIRTVASHRSASPVLSLKSSINGAPSIARDPFDSRSAIRHEQSARSLEDETVASLLSSDPADSIRPAQPASKSLGTHNSVYGGFEDEGEESNNAAEFKTSESSTYVPTSSTKEQLAMQDQYQRELQKRHEREEADRADSERRRREAAAIISVQRAQAEEAAARMLAESHQKEREKQDRDALEAAEQKAKEDAEAQTKAEAEQRALSAQREQEDLLAAQQREKKLRDESLRNAKQDVSIRMQQSSNSAQVVLTGFVSTQVGPSMRWRRRFFHLTPRDLLLYKAKEDTQSTIDSIRLAGHTKSVDLTAEELLFIPHSMKLNFVDAEEEPVLLYCDDADDLTVLVYAIRLAAGLKV